MHMALSDFAVNQLGSICHSMVQTESSLQNVILARNLHYVFSSPGHRPRPEADHRPLGLPGGGARHLQQGLGADPETGAQ